MTDLWTEASYDHEAEQHEAALDLAGAHMASVMPFLLQAQSGHELEHRLSFAAMRLEHIGTVTGVPASELAAMARRHYALLKQALPEGYDPLAQVMQAPQGGYGSGPEKPDEHEEGPDFSYGYSEIPQGAPGGPVPQVVTPVFERPQQVTEATAARRTCSACGCSLTKKGKCGSCKNMPGSCTCNRQTASLRRRADAGDYLAETPPDTNTGRGSTDLDVGEKAPSLPSSAGSLRRRADSTAGPGDMASTLPAGVGGGASGPDGSGAAPQAAPQAPLQTTMTSDGPDTTYDMTGPTQQQVTSSRRDRVADQVRHVAATVRASNPHLPESECRRIARRTVGSYLRTADNVSGIMSDQPWQASPGSQPQDGSSSGAGPLGHMLEWQGLKSVLPGGGAAGAGAAEDAAAAAAL